MNKSCRQCVSSTICKMYIHAIMVDFKIVRKIAKTRRSTDSLWQGYVSEMAKECIHFKDVRKKN